MYLLGLFVSAQFRRRRTRRTSPTSTSSRSRPSARSTTPRSALDAPIDTWQIAAKSPNLAAETDAAKAYLEFWAKGSTQLIMFQNQPGVIPTANDADTSNYSDLQKKAVEIVGKAQRITQFLDRDTRSDFAARTACSASSRRSSRTRPGPGRLPEDHPGLLGLRCRRLLDPIATLS